MKDVIFLLGVYDFLSDKILSNIYDYVKNKLEEHKLKDSLKEYADCQKIHFDVFNNGQTYDWEGLQVFIESEKIRKISAIFLLPDMCARRRMTGHVYACAYAAAQVDNHSKQDSVEKYLNGVIEIVGGHLIGQIENFLPFNQVVDQICSHLDDMEKDLKHELQNQTKTILNAINYKGSFEEWVNSCNRPNESTNRFHYMNKNIAFYGREDEIKIIDNFLAAEPLFLVTAVTAPAGTGKSKFMHNYAQKIENMPNWNTVFLSVGVDKLIEFAEQDYPTNLLIIIDYAGQYADKLGDWFNAIATNGKPRRKLRVALLERVGVDDKQESQMATAWYDRLISNHNRLKERWWALGEKLTLELPYLSQEYIYIMLDDFAKCKGHSFTEEDKLAIVDHTIKIDKRDIHDIHDTLVRPLIALMVADAYISKQKDFANDLISLLGEIINSYKNYWKMSLCNNDNALAEALEELIVYATATGGWRLDQALPEPFNQSLKKLESEFSEEEVNTILCNAIEKVGDYSTLTPFEPDLLGEYLVLKHLSSNIRSRIGKVKAFTAKLKYYEFLERCIDDYATTHLFSGLFNNAMDSLMPEGHITITSNKPYSTVLSVLSSKQTLQESTKSVNRLAKIFKTLNNKESLHLESIISYSHALAILADKQDLVSAKNSIEKLGLLSEFLITDDWERVYAYGLCKLSQRQDEIVADNTVKTIYNLYKKCCENNEMLISELYAEALYNLSLKQNIDKAERTIKKLCFISNVNHESAANIHNYLFHGLLLLSSKQDELKAKQSMDKLEIIFNKFFSKDKEMLIKFTLGLINLSFKQSCEEAVKTLEKFYPYIPDPVVKDKIIELGALSKTQCMNDKLETFNKLDELQSGQPEIYEEVVGFYMHGLLRLLSRQNEVEAVHTLDKIIQVCKGVSLLRLGIFFAFKTVRIQSYAFFNMANKQNTVEKTVLRIKELLDYFIQIPQYCKADFQKEFNLLYAKSLVNLIYKQELVDAQNTIGIIEKMMQKPVDDIEINGSLKKLYNLGNRIIIDKRNKRVSNYLFIDIII